MAHCTILFGGWIDYSNSLRRKSSLSYRCALTYSLPSPHGGFSSLTG